MIAMKRSKSWRLHHRSDRNPYHTQKPLPPLKPVQKDVYAKWKETVSADLVEAMTIAAI